MTVGMGKQSSDQSRECDLPHPQRASNRNRIYYGGGPMVIRILDVPVHCSRRSSAGPRQGGGAGARPARRAGAQCGAEVLPPSIPIALYKLSQACLEVVGVASCAKHGHHSQAC